MRSDGAQAAQVITNLLSTGEMWRYFVTGPEQQSGFQLMVDGGYLEHQLQSVALLPSIVDQKLDVDTLYRILNDNLTTKVRSTTLSIDESKPLTIERATFLQSILDTYHEKMEAAHRASPRDIIAEQLIAIVELCKQLPQPLNPLILHLLCLQNNFVMPLMADLDVFAEGSTHSIVFEMQKGIAKTQQLLDGEPIVAVESSHFEHVTEDLRRYDTTCKTLSSKLTGSYGTSTITSTKILLIHAATTNDVEALMMYIDELRSDADFNRIMTHALIEAAQYGNTAFVKAVLDNTGLDVDSASTDGLTALHAAAEYNQRKTVELLLHRGADPHVVYDGTTVFNAALHTGMVELAYQMIEDHIKHPNTNVLGDIDTIDQAETQMLTELAFLLQAIESNNIAMVAKCVELGFIYSEETYRQALDIIAENATELEPAQRFLLLSQLPSSFGDTPKFKYLLGKMNIEDTLMLCHVCLQSPPRNDSELRQITLFTYHALQKILAEGSTHQLEQYLDTILVHACASIMPIEYKMTLAAGAIETHDNSILHTLCDANNIAAIQTYIGVVVNASVLDDQQKIELVTAKRMYGMPMKSTSLADILYMQGNTVALNTYVSAILDSHLDAQAKASLITPTALQSNTVLKELIRSGNTEEACLFLTVMSNPGQLSTAQQERLFSPVGEGDKKYRKVLDQLTSFCSIRQVIDFVNKVLTNATLTAETKYAFLNPPTQKKGEAHIEYLMKHGRPDQVADFVNSVCNDPDFTVEQKHNLISPAGMKKGHTVIEYLFKHGSPNEVGGFIRTVCNTMPEFNTDQKYRLVWPLGSSKSKGLHEQFDRSASKTETVCAYLTALITSRLSELVKEKIVRKLKQHLGLPINGESLQPLDLAVLGYHHSKPDLSCSLFCKSNTHTNLAANLTLVLNQELPTEDDEVHEFVTDKIRETYLHPNMADKENGFARTLKALADWLKLSLEPINAEDDTTLATESTAATFYRDRDLSAPIAVPQRPTEASPLCGKKDAGLSYGTAASETYQDSFMTQRMKRSASGTLYTMEEKHSGNVAEVDGDTAAAIPAM
ncbi:MAG: ankyrin repeat domain-containing protein [Coxiellaceae bacterium]|nr:ankyrin repeat domain-containing protein [Coxiellaceae bacterium]